ncbi:MAG: hypothetical protein ACRD6I_14410, partial [Candidatus Acidiferrales bacterium]
RAFEDAARQIGVWILARRTKPGALPYIGLGGYVPKPINCKAKPPTATGRRARGFYARLRNVSAMVLLAKPSRVA